MESRLEAFWTWFVASGGYVHPAAEFLYTADKGVHLRVKPVPSGSTGDVQSAISPGTRIISCPHSLTLSALDACGSSILPSRYQGDQPFTSLNCQSIVLSPDVIASAPRPACLAALWLCVQRSMGRRSHRKPYLDCLPALPRDDSSAVKFDSILAEIDTPMWWTREERSWFEGSPLQTGVNVLERLWVDEWNSWGPAVNKWAASAGNEVEKVTWPMYKWALTTLGARAFSSSNLSHVKLSADKPLLSHYNPDVLLYPGMDMLNHSCTTKNTWQCDIHGFAIVCEDDVKPGDEINNSYGAKNNGQLLLSYGFCIKNALGELSMQGNIDDAFPLKVPDQAYTLLDSLAAKDLYRPPEQYSLQSLDPTRQPSRIPEPHDPTRTTFYIRHPWHTIIRRDSSYPHLEPSLPGYPRIYINSPGSVPTTLLDRLSSLLANARERDLAMKTFKVADSQKEFFGRLGPRNVFATRSLLVDRLSMERKRLRTGLTNIRRAVANESSVSENSQGGERRAQRLQKAQNYMNGQYALVNLSISYIAEKNSSCKAPPQFLGLGQALEWLALYNQEAWYALRAGINTRRLMGHNANNSLAVFNVSTTELIQESLDYNDEDGFNNSEEDMWALWLGTMLQIQTPDAGTNGGQRYKSGQKRVTSLQQHHREINAWLRHIRQTYGPSQSSQYSGTDADLETLDQLTKVIAASRQRYRQFLRSQSRLIYQQPVSRAPTRNHVSELDPIIDERLVARSSRSSSESSEHQNKPVCLERSSASESSTTNSTPDARNRSFISGTKDEQADEQVDDSIWAPKHWSADTILFLVKVVKEESIALRPVQERDDPTADADDSDDDNDLWDMHGCFKRKKELFLAVDDTGVMS